MSISLSLFWSLSLSAAWRDNWQAIWVGAIALPTSGQSFDTLCLENW
ncbi:hypothetical protein [Limnothrix redekei]|uniref:Uncharacterized protein n=1 Tax=Limnothrix redekei LRLZ20PSL1 TaxID=3112953 RepID=A0ABW7C8C2_9CYAN